MIGTLTVTILLLTSLAGAEGNASEQGTLAEKITETSATEQKPSRAPYVFGGCLLGGLGGYFLGFAIGCSIGKEEEEGPFKEFNEAMNCMKYAGIGGIIGGVLGGFIGFGTGKHAYEMIEERKPPSEYKSPLEGSSSLRFQVIPLQRNSYQGFVVVAQYSF